MHSRAFEWNGKKKKRKRRKKGATKFIPDLSRRFCTRRRCPSVDDYVDVVGATWCLEKKSPIYLVSTRPSTTPFFPSLLPSFFLSFASSSSIISLFRIVRAGRKRWWWCVRACTRFATPPTHLPWSQCHGEPTRADTWPQVAERELGNLVYPGRE